MQEVTGRIAMIVGASGLVGSQLLRVLLANTAYTRVVAVSRRPLSVSHPRLANRVLRFENMEQDLQGSSCHDAFCCLGTTLRQAGSIAAFRAVDHDLVLRFARLVRQSGTRQFLGVSSIGANPQSKNQYLRTKGETEEALVALKFPSLHLMQPGLLLGERRERRVAELMGAVVMTLLNPLLLGNAQRWRAIPAHTVAEAMNAAAMAGRNGVQRYSFSALRRLAPPRSTPLRM
jgi:uncharacterized protein YbjT (DUF2867 family)